MARSHAAAATAGESINVVSWGGAYQFSQIEGYQKPYANKTGVSFTNIEKSANGPALLTAQQQSGNVIWDVVDMLQVV